MNSDNLISKDSKNKEETKNENNTKESHPLEKKADLTQPQKQEKVPLDSVRKVENPPENQVNYLNEGITNENDFLYSNGIYSSNMPENNLLYLSTPKFYNSISGSNSLSNETPYGIQEQFPVQFTQSQNIYQNPIADFQSQLIETHNIYDNINPLPETYEQTNFDTQYIDVNVNPQNICFIDENNQNMNDFQFDQFNQVNEFDHVNEIGQANQVNTVEQFDPKKLTQKELDDIMKTKENTNQSEIIQNIEIKKDDNIINSSNEINCSEVKNNEVKQSEVQQSEVKQSEVKKSDVINSEVINSEVIHSEVINSDVVNSNALFNNKDIKEEVNVPAEDIQPILTNNQIENNIIASSQIKDSTQVAHSLHDGENESKKENKNKYIDEIDENEGGEEKNEKSESIHDEIKSICSHSDNENKNVVVVTKIEDEEDIAFCPNLFSKFVDKIKGFMKK